MVLGKLSTQILLKFKLTTHHWMIHLVRVHATMQSDRFKKGMDKDVYDGIKIDRKENVSDKMKPELFNKAITFISVQQRTIELYGLVKAEIGIMKNLLGKKCIK